uniref:FecR domain-containing protein n=1 Tax=Marinobacterium profundum TaxID=1714300 RepID=UPI000ABE37F9|nr:FecR domain-containing protein [Marinobacterium profundum]
MNNLLSSASLRSFFLVLVLQLLPVQLWAQDWVYTVVEGDSLWNLSEKHLDRVTRFEQVRKLNGIQDPENLRPGTRVRIPLKWIRSNAVPAQVSSVTGSAQMIRAGATVPEPLQQGAMLQLGDKVITAAESSVAIRFADDSILSLQASSQVQFDNLSAHGETGMVDTRMNLIEGRMITRVTPAVGPGSRFEIQTPSAISAVRGTEYRASVAANGGSNIEVLHGKVAVSGGRKQALVKSGYGTQVETGKAPLKPRLLLPAPVLEPVPAVIEQLNWRLAWAEMDKASGYRVEVSDNADFDTILWQQRGQYRYSALPDVPDGSYHIRVRAIDDLGLEGLNADQQILINARPQPPLQLKPRDAQVLRGAGPDMLWTQSEDATSYRVQVARDENFSELILDESELDSDRYDGTAMAELGTYYWRLRSRAADGEEGPLGAVRSYEVKPMPAAIDAAVAADDDGMLLASWQGAEDQTFQAQLASDKAFTQLLRDEQLSEPQIAIEPMQGKSRYLRVRSIESDGYQGPWGATQKIAPIPDHGIWWVIMVGVLGVLAL